MVPRGAGDEARLIAVVLQAFEEAGDDFEPVLDLVCGLGCALTGDPWIIRLVDDDDTRLYLAGSAAPDAETTADIRATMSGLRTRSPTSRVWSAGTPMKLTREVQDANRGNADPATVALADRRGFDGGCLAPMRVRGRVIGVLWWACQHHDGDHGDEDLTFAASVADRCALAIDNARLVRTMRAERNRHVALLAQVSDAICVVDANGVITDAVPGGITRLLGWEVEEVLGKNVFDLVHRKDHERALEGFVHAIGPDDLKPMVLRVRHRGGEWRHLQVSGQNLLDDPAVEGVVITGHDVTEMVMADAVLVAENEILGLVASDAGLNATLDSICRMVDDRVGGTTTLWLLDEEADALIAVSGPGLAPEGRAEVGNAEQGIGGASWVHLLPEGVFVSDPEVDENWADWRDEARRWGIRCSWTRPIRDDDGRMLGALIIYRSMLRAPSPQQEQLTELAARLAGLAVRRDRDAQSLAHAATHDSVTGAANRTLFAARLQAAVARQRRGSAPPAVLFIDLDHFKQLNDRAGHSAGDISLRMLAERLTSIVRPSDVVARYGGDEFAVLLEETGDDEAMVVAQRLLSAISEPIDTGRRKHRLSASIGIAIGRPSIDADALVRRADLAMYRAKAAGRGRIERFQIGLLSGTAEHDLEHDLRVAVATGVLTVDYQPIADLQRGTWVGVEALARWQHPTLGSVTPAMFVPLAEETGLIGTLGEHILDLVLADGAAWVDDPLMSPMILGVNVSGRQLSDPTFVSLVSQRIAKAGVDPRRLFLELTETAMMEDFEAARTTIRALRDLGVNVAIDDFGTGHSTLARLRQFPAIGLKLDRSFIEDLADDQRSEDVVAAVVQLAHAVGMVVCAEGVESYAQLAVLHRLAVDLAQGFLLARPVPASELRAVLARPPMKVQQDGVLRVVR